METITMDAMVVSLLVGTILPLLVGIVTKVDLDSRLKSIALLTLSAVQGLIVNATVLDGSAVLSKESLILAGVGWVTAVATYFGFLKPSGITEAVSIRTAKFGVGRR